MPPKVKAKSSRGVRQNSSNGRKKPSQPNVQPDYEMNAAMLRIIQNSSLLSRSMLSSRLGVQFDGQRNLYETFGYKLFPDFQDYKNMYDRHGLGHRIVTKFADSTWNKTPILIDGEQRSDTLDKDATKFLEEWDNLVNRLGITQVMRQADIMAQIGQFSILFLGVSGDDYSQPVKKGDGLFFLSAYDESQVSIQSLIVDPKNEKFGMPETYTIAFNSIDTGVIMPGGNLVHHTRLVHVAEDKLGSRIYGTPRLKAPMNRLWDLEKTTGGGAEAAWLATWGGLLFTTQEGMKVPDTDSEEAKVMDEEMQKFFHRIQRYAIMQGVDVQDMGVREVRIKDIYDTLKTDLAGTVGIPQRILFGSERGELASSQDMQEWNSLIETRRTNYAEPEILRPFIKFCIDTNVLPPPKSGKWKVEWYPPYSMTQVEKAQYAESLARGANSITGGVPETAMDIDEWRNAAGLPVREDVGMDESEEGFNSDEDLEEEADSDLESGNGKFPVLKDGNKKQF